ncbi:MAG: efflux RND transporter periplasmic adaptor subunit [Wenzhouxiangella sp.]|nr:MAG: efflux RND transporter periplasmic adaptor subunit [Wenzhouxiangella sp.]
MDIRRPQARGRRWRQVLTWVVPVILVLVLMGVATALLQRPPAVDAERIWTGTVERGELVREVAAAGTLVAPRLRAVTNRNAGVIEEVLVLPGDQVNSGDALIVMSSPDLDEELASARWDLAAAEAEEAVQQVEAENRRLDLIAQLAQAESEYTGALLELQAQEELADAQVFSAIELERSRLRVSQLRRRLEAEQARSERAPELRQAQRDAAQARLARHRDKVAHLEGLVELLSVRAPTDGIVQDVLVQEGERLGAGQLVARIVDPEHLIARLRVPEREASDVLIGLPVRLELGRETIAGEVSRVDPSARDRHIDVDVALTSDRLPGLRPDQSISGRIELERLDDVLYLPRPAQARSEGQQLIVFVVDNGERHARRREVEIGRLSARHAEIIAGLNPGERVVLADLSEFEDHERVRLRQ